ncbi:hypothetical protein [Streptomyces sp. NBC_00525]|uniref:hypothetical protein n=1 Tax=Streptomyces sp. NBC_00525 TaxID=2903660 RepID=UPI002E7FE5E6|nr:hypothetical protein [Streptomyces sp. NBC_00525]WUC98135.1 hypothetical protein OG710_31210 [Streptomyces sp. NBC_00525]
MDRVAEAVAAGFRSSTWHQMANELYAYAFKTLRSKMRRTDELMELVAKSNTPLKLTDEDRSTLHRNSDDRALIAVMTINVAMETFPELLKKGGYNPADNPGKDGRFMALKSFFVTRCGLVFPRVFNNWKAERTDRFLRQAKDNMEGWRLAQALGQYGSERVPPDVAALCDTVTAMIDALKPRNRAVWHMTVDGFAPGEIADALGIKLYDVNNALYTLRTKAKALRQKGELVIPPSIEAEWARRREQDSAGRRWPSEHPGSAAGPARFCRTAPGRRDRARWGCRSRRARLGGRAVVVGGRRGGPRHRGARPHPFRSGHPARGLRAQAGSVAGRAAVSGPARRARAPARRTRRPRAPMGAPFSSPRRMMLGATLVRTRPRGSGASPSQAGRFRPSAS